MKVNVRIEDKIYTVEIEDLDANPVVAMVEGQCFEVWTETQQDTPVPLVAVPLSTIVHKNGHNRNVLAPIPGVIIAVSVVEGQEITKGQEVCVLEAMKMKQSIRAAHGGKILSVPVSVGQQVKHHEMLVEIGD